MSAEAFDWAVLLALWLGALGVGSAVLAVVEWIDRRCNFRDKLNKR